MRTYGRWWNEAPSRTSTFMPQSVGEIDSQDFIDIEFEQPVYPCEINIYETYNPGAVVSIWAADPYGKWSMLWEGEPQEVGHVSRIFSPELKRIDFPTRVLRVEFYHLHLDYYTELDAILLKGSKEFGYRPSKTAASHYDDMKLGNIGKLTSQILELNIQNIPPQIDITNSLSTFLGEELPRFLSEVQEGCHLNYNSKNEIGKLSGRSFDCLPDETVLKIFGYLDLLSLCRCAQVSRHFRDLATDSLLYTELNLKVYWYCTTSKALETLAGRCQYLQKLDLSWCGSLKSIRSCDFVNFLNQSGSQLTHLRLNSCLFANDTVIIKVAIICKNLKELALRNCSEIRGPGFQALSCLDGLLYLDLYRTLIELGPLQDILQNSRHLKHLNIGSCVHVSSMDEVAQTLASCNPHLISVDFWKTYSLTPAGVKALGHCSNLEEVDLGWCLGFGAPGDSLLAVAKGCPHLKKLFLAALRGVGDRDLEPFIELCPEMEQVDLLGVRSITPEICIKFLTRCEKLKLLDVSFCDQVPDSQVAIWRHLFPNICIKRSFQRSTEMLTPTHQ
ncbi:F-box/LRR-repeat protein 4 isoform X2 [Anabrus simplex]